MTASWNHLEVQREAEDFEAVCGARCSNGFKVTTIWKVTGVVYWFRSSPSHQRFKRYIKLQKRGDYGGCSPKCLAVTRVIRTRVSLGFVCRFHPLCRHFHPSHVWHEMRVGAWHAYIKGQGAVFPLQSASVHTSPAPSSSKTPLPEPWTSGDVTDSAEVSHSYSHFRSSFPVSPLDFDPKKLPEERLNFMPLEARLLFNFVSLFTFWWTNISQHTLPVPLKGELLQQDTTCMITYARHLISQVEGPLGSCHPR